MTPCVFISKDIAPKLVIGNGNRGVTIGPCGGGGGGDGGGGDGDGPYYYLYASGDNSKFQLLEPYYSYLYSPIQIPLEDVVKVVSATPGGGVASTKFALKSDGTLWGWGQGSFAGFNLFNGQAVYTETPIQISGSWLKIAAGDYSVIGIQDDGTLWGWGKNNNYNLGLGYGGVVTDQTQISSETDWVDISVGAHSLGIRGDTIYGWGNNDSGELGLGYTSNFVAAPTTNGSVGWGAVKVVGGTSYAQDTSSVVYTNQTSLFVSTSLNWDDVGIPSNGYKLSGSTIWELQDGQLFRPLLGGDIGATEVFNNYNDSTYYAIDGTNTYVWGYAGTNNKRGIGMPLPTGVEYKDIFSRLNADKIWRSGSLNFYNNSHFVIKNDKTLWGWGDNRFGQLGVGDKTFNTSSFRQVGTNTWKTVSCGLSTTAGITTDGKLHTWGRNFYGALLGNGLTTDTNETDQLTPLWIAQDSTWETVAMGSLYALAIKSDGTLWSWGSASNGVMGLGVNETASGVPVQVGSDSDWKHVQASSYVASFGLKDDGTLWAWGNNLSGLGLGDADVIYNVPTQVGEDTWNKVVNNNRTTYAIKSDGTLWGWGENVDYYIQNTVYTDAGITGVYSSTALLTGGAFLPESGSSTRITTTAGTCVTSSISNVLLGSASLAVNEIASDEGNVEITLPFNISFNGASYSTIYVNTNSYVTFGTGYEEYQVSATVPPVDKIFISGYDNYAYRVYYGQEGSTFRIRWEGNSEYDEEGTAKIWEMVFYQDTPNQIDIHIAENGNYTNAPLNYQPTPGPIITPPWRTQPDDGLTGIFSSSSLLVGGEFIPESSSSIRILTTTGSCTTSSISNVLLGSASLTLSTSAAGDEGNWELILPFSASFNGTSYSKIYVNTNSYVTFGTAYSVYQLTPSNPAVDKICISACDNYGYRIYYGTEGNTFRIRWEGNTKYDQTGTLKIWEMVLYEETPNQIDIHIGPNDNYFFAEGITANDTWTDIAIGIDARNGGRAIRSDGSLWVWGENDFGELGGMPGIFQFSGPTVPTQLNFDKDWKAVYSGEHFTVALKDS